MNEVKPNEEFKIPLSEFVKKLMYRVMKNSTHVVQGFIFFRNRIISKVYYDEEACDQLLKDIVINKDNVLSYLNRKYIPTYTETGAIFKDQACIQKVDVKPDKSLLIYINKSEPHKIITDAIHVMKLLEQKDFTFTPHIKFYINQVQIAYQDTLLYNVLLKEFGFKPPAQSIQYGKELLAKFGKLEAVAKIKKRSVKRKFLRHRAKIGLITWTELRKIINITDFSERNIRVVCNEIRAAAKERGIKKIDL